jgi:hypothetical protein
VGGKNGIPLKMFYFRATIDVNLIINCIPFEVLTRMFYTISNINKPPNTTSISRSVA